MEWSPISFSIITSTLLLVEYDPALTFLHTLSDLLLETEVSGTIPVSSYVQRRAHYSYCPGNV